MPPHTDLHQHVKQLLKKNESITKLQMRVIKCLQHRHNKYECSSRLAVLPRAELAILPLSSVTKYWVLCAVRQLPAFARNYAPLAVLAVHGICVDLQMAVSTNVEYSSCF